MPTRIKLLVSTTVLLLGFLVSPFFAIPVQAQSGIVCIEPSSTTSCPPPTVLSGPINTQLKVAVNIQNSPGLNGFDISVKTNPSILSLQSFDTTGNVFTGQNIIVIRNCINGAGTACQTGVDGPGVASLAIVAINFITPTPTTGRLFAINYNIIGSSASTPIVYPTGCTNTSNDGFCVTIANGGVAAVPESLQTATFSNASSFSVSANPASLNVVPGDSGTSTITLTSIGGFSGTVTLSTVLSPAAKHAPQISLSASTVTLTSGGTTTSTLTVSSNGATSPGSYSITLTAASTSGTGSLVINLTVLAK